MKVFIEPHPVFLPEVIYIWNLFCHNQQINFQYVNDKDHADFSIGCSSDFDLRINEQVYQLLLKKKPPVEDFIRNKGLFLLEDGTVDYLTAAFFMVSCAQELGSESRDEFNRFPFASSYQFKMGNYDQNLVQQYFDKLREHHPELNSQIKTEKAPSVVFLSHDIDTVFGSLLQDTFATVKKGNAGAFVNCIATNLYQGPHWLNMSKITEIEMNYNFHSTFFWLARKGKSPLGVGNADYDFQSEKIQQQVEIVTNAGSHNGIHKSISNETFSEEMQSFKFNVIANRYHFLAFNPHDDFKKIEDAGLLLDASLAYAEGYGFRNNYALPYRPYLFSERRAAAFVEVPLNLMDTTFYNYLKQPAAKATVAITNFIDANKKNAVISLLWHNNFISDYKYKEYSEAYTTILAYLEAQQLKTISPDEIIKKYM